MHDIPYVNHVNPQTGVQAIIQLMMEAGGLLGIQGPSPSMQFHLQMNRSCSCRDQTMPMALEMTLTWRYGQYIAMSTL